MRTLDLKVLALCVVLGVQPAFAGRECKTVPPTQQAVSQALALAQSVAQALDQANVPVALLGRVGSDQSARGVRYTHVGFAQRDHAKGRWTVTHLLNACGQGDSDLFDEGLANFFLDDLFAYETQVVLPSARVQANLLAALNGPAKRAMHQREYSVIANPWSTRFQNSNNWALEVLAVALATPGEIRTREQAQTWLGRTGFVANKIRISAGERAGSRLFTANVRYTDHPDSAWQTQTYEIASGDGVLSYLMLADLDARSWKQTGTSAPVLLREGRLNAPSQAARAAHLVTPAVTPPPPATPTAPAAASPRARILAGTRSVLQGYACRETGYLRQCQQLSAERCETMVRAAINDCFAPISDAELLEAERSSALGVVERVGMCAVADIDQSLGPLKKRAVNDQGQSCADFRTYK